MEPMFKKPVHARDVRQWDVTVRNVSTTQTTRLDLRNYMMKWMIWYNLLANHKDEESPRSFVYEQRRNILKLATVRSCSYWMTGDTNFNQRLRLWLYFFDEISCSHSKTGMWLYDAQNWDWLSWAGLINLLFWRNFDTSFRWLGATVGVSNIHTYLMSNLSRLAREDGPVWWRFRRSITERTFFWFGGFSCRCPLY